MSPIGEYYLDVEMLDVRFDLTESFTDATSKATVAGFACCSSALNMSTWNRSSSSCPPHPLCWAELHGL
jgi:hypothetical protein